MVEHQSTINENMPLRMLLYLARVYEKMIDNDKIYHEDLVKIPTPQLIVFYNGKKKYPPEIVLKLSDAFEEQMEDFDVQIKVRVVNINYDPKNEVLAASRTLRDYSYFIAKIRGYEKKGYSRDEAIKQSIEECIAEGVMKEFLEENSSEVFNMIFTEFNMDDALRVREEEGILKGQIEGEMKIITAIKKKKEKGLDKRYIADTLELEEEYVEEVMETLDRYPKSSIKDVTRIIVENNRKILA